MSAHHLAVPSLLLAALAATPSVHAQARWKLTETLRIGGDEAGPASFLITSSIEADAKGRIFVYDRKTQDIRVFGADGKLVKVIGRLGSGPGELRDAEGIAFTRDGKLWVRDAANARFSIFSSEGVYENAWTMKFCTSQGGWTPHMDGRGRIVDEDCIVSGGRATRTAVLAYHTDMSRVDSLWAMPPCGDDQLNEAGTWIRRNARGASYRSIPYAPSAHSVLGPDGEVWCVPNSSRFEIVRYKTGALDTRVHISRSAPTVPVTAAEHDSIVKRIEAKGPTGYDFSRIPKVKPAIDRITVDDQGRLWVRHTNAKGAIEFDIYSSNGRIIATAELGVYNSSVFQPFVVRGDNVYTVVLDQDDVQHVARFRITR